MLCRIGDLTFSFGENKMDREEYALTREIQDRHWLWLGRQKILQTLIEKHLDLSHPLRIADLGCGYGGNIPALMQYGHVTGLEPYADAVQFVTKRFSGKAEALAWTMPEPLDRRFDLIAMIEVLEHLEDDAAAVDWLSEHLAPGGHVIITTPAHRILWTQMDDVVHHYRRYDRKMLRSLFEKKFEIVFFSYYNFFLFPLKLAFVIFDRLERQLFGKMPKKSYNDIPPFPANEICRQITFLEASAMKRGISFPWGASIALLARRRD